MLKKAFLLLLLFLFITPIAFAHSGDTDSRGGHYNRSTGEYHYHHGYPAHDHDGGVCPYDYDDKTGWNSGSSSTKNQSYTLETTYIPKEKEPPSLFFVALMIFVAPIALGILGNCALSGWYYFVKKEKDMEKWFYLTLSFSVLIVSGYMIYEGPYAYLRTAKAVFVFAAATAPLYWIYYYADWRNKKIEAKKAEEMRLKQLKEKRQEQRR